MGGKPSGGGGSPVQQSYQPAPAAVERKKVVGKKTASMYAGAINEKQQEEMANVARKKLLGE